MNLRHDLNAFTIGVRELPSGGFKVIAVGTPDYHLMDWRGMNCHYGILLGQPQRGFKTLESALIWLFDNYAIEREALDAFNARRIGGTWTDGAGLWEVEWVKRGAYKVLKNGEAIRFRLPAPG